MAHMSRDYEGVAGRVERGFDSGVVQAILDVQEARRLRGELKHVMVVCDDLGDTTFYRLPVFKTLVFNGRHYNCSVIVQAQEVVNALSPAVRRNADVLLFGGLNEGDTGKLYSDMKLSMTKPEFVRFASEHLLGRIFGMYKRGSGEAAAGTLQLVRASGPGAAAVGGGGGPAAATAVSETPVPAAGGAAAGEDPSEEKKPYNPFDEF